MKRLKIILFLLLTTQLSSFSLRKNEKVHIKVDSDPEFVFSGCDNTKDCIELYVNTHAIWPTEDDIQATIYIQCIVEKNGKLTNFKIVRGLEARYDKASIDIIKSMPMWKSGKLKGKKVRTQITIPVKWDLIR